MQNRFTLFFIAAAQVCLAAPVPADSQLRLALSLYGYGAESQETQSRIAGTEIEGAFSHRLSPTFEARVAGGVQVETGAARIRWSTDFQPRQIQRLREAQVAWTPLKELRFIAGAVDQLRWQSPLLLQRQSFPALFESFEKSLGAFTLRAEAQQAVPADTSSLQPWGNWPQGMPGFYLERLSVRFSPSEQLELGVLGSHFLYENLSGPSAYQAQFLGNSVVGIDANTSYLYGFSGFEWGAWAKGRVGHFHPEMRASLLRNAAAPQDKSTGWRLVGAVGWDYSSAFRLTPQIEGFRVESDASPAFYNDRVFGHGNRNGFGASVVADWPQAGISASARWVHSRVLVANPYQSNLDWVQVQLSTQYDVF